MAIGDLDGDGVLDLAVANFDSDDVSVLVGDGAGGFAAATNFAAGNGPRALATGDLDRAGVLDLAVANFNSNDVSVLVGDGAGSFAAPTNFAVGGPPVSVAIGDLDGDGDLDLAVANFNNVSVLLNTTNPAPTAGDDTYTTGQDTPLTVPAPGVLVNDSDPDDDALTAVVVTGPAHGTLNLNPDGSFAYTPAAAYNGPDTFTYQASDGSTTSNVATVSLTVGVANAAPTTPTTRPGGMTLPPTGGDLGPPQLIGVALLLGGAVLAVASRRGTHRTRPTDQ